MAQSGNESGVAADSRIVNTDIVIDEVEASRTEESKMEASTIDIKANCADMTDFFI